MANERSEGMQIGRVLKETRTRAGLEIRAVEEQTKIRVKYLRALEDEQWDVLPSPAYAKGFLRTYAQLLRLDAEALVDEYRRQVEADSEPPYPVGEQLLERRRRTAGPPLGGVPMRAVVIVAALAIVGALLVLGLTGGDENGEEGREAAARREARQERRAERRQQQRRERRQQAAEGERVELELAINSPVAVCLLGDSDEELIDGQVLAAGTDEGPYSAERFELRFPSGYDRGQFELRLGEEPHRLPETLGPTAYVITAPAKVRPAAEPGPGCP